MLDRVLVCYKQMLVDTLSVKESVCFPTRFCRQRGVMAGSVTRLAWKFILPSSAGCWAENGHPISLFAIQFFNVNVVVYLNISDDLDS